MYNGISFMHKKKEIPLFATTWMDIQGIMLTDISQSEKYKYYIILYVGSKKRIHRYSEKSTHRLQVAKGGGMCEMGEGGQKRKI